VQQTTLYDLVDHLVGAREQQERHGDSDYERYWDKETTQGILLSYVRRAFPSTFQNHRDGELGIGNRALRTAGGLENTNIATRSFVASCRAIPSR
jgi:hypothetical protein